MYARVQVSKTEAHEDGSHGPKDWQVLIAPTVKVCSETDWQLQGNVARSVFVHVGFGQNVHGGKEPVVTSTLPHR